MTKTAFNFESIIDYFNLKTLSAEKERQLKDSYQALVQKEGRGNEFLGWLDLPKTIKKSEIEQIELIAQRLTKKSAYIVVIGIGGSYLGARAIIEALQPYFPFMQKENLPQIIFAGNSLSEDYLHDLLLLLDKNDYSLIVISKSGTTIEPALAFRLLKNHYEKKYGKSVARERIVAITDASRGILKQIAEKEKYHSFIIPDDIGGRYSVLTPVGLLPVAVAGFDISKLLYGAKRMRERLLASNDWQKNPALQYAFLRYLLYLKENKKIELMVTYEPKLYYFIEWFKQLFGESEGKELKGIFPTGAVFSTDLHSLGQYVQEGERIIFETVISVQNSKHKVDIPYLQEDDDKLNYLIDKSINQINLIAEEGTRLAHIAGGVPNFTITIPQIDEDILGELIYFFEFSCALGGYLLRVNPFDQPGVEAYKNNMFKLLGK